MFKRIKKDINAVFERDPAAKNLLEVILCYPGFHAILLHRIAHFSIKGPGSIAPAYIPFFKVYYWNRNSPGSQTGNRDFYRPWIGCCHRGDSGDWG